MILTVQERVQLMLDFAQVDLDQLRAGDWLNLREDLLVFIQGTRQEGPVGEAMPIWDTGGLIGVPLTHPLPQEMTAEEVHALQAEVRSFLQAMIPSSEELQRMPMAGMAVLPTARVKFVFHRVGLIQVIGSTREAVLLTLGWLITSLPPDSLLRCPECAAVVLRHRKNQDYCSRRCVTRVNQRHRRAPKRPPAATS
jgi:hypothetical protein